MTKIELEKAKFLLVSREPDKPYEKVPSIELILKISKTSITTLDTATFLERTYQIQIKKNRNVIFPNIPEVRLGEHQHLYAIQQHVIKHRGVLTTRMNERRKALEEAIAEAKEFEGFCAKLKKKLPHDFED